MMNSSIAQDIFAREYAIGLVKAIEIVNQTGNTTFLIHTSTGGYVLRMGVASGARERTKKEVEEEVFFLRFLEKQGLPVGSIVQSTSGGFVICHESCCGFLRTYLSGHALINPTHAQIAQVGQLLGAIHVASLGYQPTFNRVHKWDLERVKTYWPENKKVILASKEGYTQDFVNLFESRLAKLSFPKELPSGMLHEDLGKRHVLWEKGVITGVIDFDRSYIGPFVADIGQAIRGWCATSEEVQSFLEGYERERVLETIELELLDTAIVFAFLERAQAFVLKGIHANDREMVQQGFDELLAIEDEKSPE